MSDLLTWATLNMWPLGSYDMLIGMDWVVSYKEKLDCCNKTFECTYDKGH